VNLSRTNKDLNDYEFIAMNNIKRAALALTDADYNKVEECLSEAMESLCRARLKTVGI
jgi:hypothetical protein